MKKSKLLIGLAAVAMLALTACQGSGGSTAETEAETKAAAESSENGGAENGSSENSGADSLGASEKKADENGKKTAAESGEEAGNGEDVVLKLAVPKAPPTLPLLHMADAGLLGDNVKMEVELITPIAIEKGLRFAIREGGRTVGSGVVSEIEEA